MAWAEPVDLHDIENTDWPPAKRGLRKGIHGTNDPIPVDVADLSALVEQRPRGAINTKLAWEKLSDEDFERLIFSLIATTAGYENPEWLMQTRAPDKGRDLSVFHVIVDRLFGTRRSRVVLQCKHWLSKSVNISDVSTVAMQMDLWTNPRVDILVIATSGRFTADAVDWIERHNGGGKSPKIEMWPESHLELLLAARPDLIAEHRLR